MNELICCENFVKIMLLFIIIYVLLNLVKVKWIVVLYGLYFLVFNCLYIDESLNLNYWKYLKVCNFCIIVI